MGIMQSLFGGSSGKSSSGSYAWPAVQQAVQPGMEAGVNAINQLGGELSGGFAGYKNNAGFGDALAEGIRGIQGGNAAKGLLFSGATGKGIMDYGTKLSSQYYDNYLNRLSQMGQMGLSAANTLTGAGQWNKSKNSSSNGILPTLFG